MRRFACSLTSSSHSHPVLLGGLGIIGRRFAATTTADGAAAEASSATGASRADENPNTNNSKNNSKAVATTAEATALKDARRQAFLESQAEWNRIHQQQQAEREARLRRQSTNTGLQSNTRVVSDVTIGKKKGPWGSFQLRDAWSADAMSRHEKDSIDARLSSENRFNPFERDRRIARLMVMAAPPLWTIGLGVAYYLMTGRYPWQADYQHLLNVLRQFDASPRSKMYMYRADGAVRRDRRYGPNNGGNNKQQSAAQ